MPDGDRPQAEAADLLDALMLAYYRQTVSQADAAKLLDMRKADFAEWAAVWAVELVEKAIEANPKQVERVRAGVEWRAYVRRFLATFPECDPRCSRRDTLRMEEGDDLIREYGAAPVKTYAGEEAIALPPAQPSLGTRYADAWDNRSIRSVSMSLERRDREPGIEDELSPQMNLDGPEFEFVEAA